ncbi:Uncharacterised protein [Vibrio cholerae]|nr:Uncharacterised protein [Vibrio cholerae]
MSRRSTRLLSGTTTAGRITSWMLNGAQLEPRYLSKSFASRMPSTWSLSSLITG